jgi:hypothetical protein
MRYVMEFSNATKWLNMNNPRCNRGHNDTIALSALKELNIKILNPFRV